MAWLTLSISAQPRHTFHQSGLHLGVVSANRGISVALFIGSWTLMTIAMMLPSTVPLFVLFGRMIEDHTEAIWLIALVVVGYVSVWTLSGVLLQLLYWLFRTIVGPVAAGAPAPIAGGVLLAIADLYQFSMLKHACLQQCRSPMSFLRSRWQGGNEFLQALRIGLEHGAFCVGCCWSLMLLMFVAGVESLSWMLVRGVVMAMEKNLPWAHGLRIPIGALLLVGTAIFFLAGARSSWPIQVARTANRGRWCYHGSL